MSENFSPDTSECNMSPKVKQYPILPNDIIMYVKIHKSLSQTIGELNKLTNKRERNKLIKYLAHQEWHIDRKKSNSIKYVVAVLEQQIVGVFEVKGIKSQHVEANSKRFYIAFDLRIYRPKKQQYPNHSLIYGTPLNFRRAFKYKSLILPANNSAVTNAVASSNSNAVAPNIAVISSKKVL